MLFSLNPRGWEEPFITSEWICGYVPPICGVKSLNGDFSLNTKLMVIFKIEGKKSYTMLLLFYGLLEGLSAQHPLINMINMYEGKLN